MPPQSCGSRLGRPAMDGIPERVVRKAAGTRSSLPNAESSESPVEGAIGAFLDDSPSVSLSLRSPARIESKELPLVRACW